MKTPKTASTMKGKEGGGHKRKHKKILRTSKMFPTSPSPSSSSSSSSSSSTKLLFRTPSPNTTSTATPTKHDHGFGNDLFQYKPDVDEDEDETNEHEEDANEDYGITDEYEDGANEDDANDEAVDYDEDAYDYGNEPNISGNDDDDHPHHNANIDDNSLYEDQEEDYDEDSDNDEEDYHDEEGNDEDDDDSDDDDISTCQCELFFNKFDLIGYLQSKTGASLIKTVSSSYANYFLRFFQWWKSTEASNKKIHTELFEILNTIDIVLPQYVSNILERQDGLSPKTCLNTLTGPYYY